MSAMVGFHTRSLRVTTTPVIRFLQERGEEEESPQRHSAGVTCHSVTVSQCQSVPVSQCQCHSGTAPHHQCQGELEHHPSTLRAVPLSTLYHCPLCHSTLRMRRSLAHLYLTVLVLPCSPVLDGLGYSLAHLYLTVLVRWTIFSMASINLPATIPSPRKQKRRARMYSPARRPAGHVSAPGGEIRLLHAMLARQWCDVGGVMSAVCECCQCSGR